MERLADEDVLEQAGAEADAALDDEHADRRERNSRPERGRERDRREPVEQRLGGEQLDVASETVVDRAENGERADAEQQRRREERLADRAVAAVPAGEARLEAVAETLQALLDPQQLAGDAAEEHREHHDED